MKRRPAKKSLMQLLDGDIRRLREAGYTLQQIGEKGGVTRERARQVIRKFYPDAKPQLLSAAQVAKVFGISESTIKNFRRRGWIHPERIGNIYRHDEKTLETILVILDRRCRICGKPIPPRNTKLCEKCSAMMRNPRLRLNLPGEREKHKKAVERWESTHMEYARRLTRKRMAEYRAEVSKRNYEISVYRVRLTYPGFRIGEHFKAIGSEKNNLVLADGRMIPTILATKVSGPKGPLSAKKIQAWEKS